jgi:hypothetical protein
VSDDHPIIRGQRISTHSGADRVKQYGSPTDRCCCCNAILSGYNPNPYCSRPSCERTHTEEHIRCKKRTIRKRPPKRRKR